MPFDALDRRVTRPGPIRTGRGLRSATTVTLAALALALSGCATGGEQLSSPSPSPTPAITTPTPTGTASPTPTEPTPTAATTPPFAADTEPDTAEGRGEPVTVTDVEVAGHDGYDRAVFHVGGGGLAGWRGEYVDDPAQQGSGEPVEVAGGATIQLMLTNTGYPGDTGAEEYDGPDRLEGGQVIREVVYGSVFEGTTQIFVGVDERRPFRVFALEDPARVVVDVVAPG